jgi:hypothetical protein
MRVHTVLLIRWAGTMALADLFDRGIHYIAVPKFELPEKP